MAKTDIDDVIVRLAEVAQLSVTSEAVTAISPTLVAWLKDANALSVKMSDEKYRALGPATILSHPSR